MKTIRLRAPHQALAAAALAGLLLAAAPLRAQEPAPRVARIERIAAQVRIDGRLDEPVWAQLTPLDGFVQTEPDEGAPVSERTEAYIFYDDQHLYFGFRCYDSQPGRIIARLGTHDARTHSDSVNIFLDPFGDRRTGYWFSINSRGVQFDALLSEGAGFDRTWDGIWHSAAVIEEWGWSAEVAIPFKSIRFQPGRTWGLNLGRDIVRKNENAHWQLVTRFDGFFRPSKAGLLEGVAGVEPGRNLEVIPYLSGRWRRGARDPRQNSSRYEPGADVRWGPLPNVTANLTVNPDFAETEADEADITISRFELFFPEKRAFFNEGSNFFATPLNLFFTRRVGARLPDGRPQRILLGGKLTGKMDGWSVGLLEARTQEARFTDPLSGEERTAPGANFLVARVQRDVWRNSTVGFLSASRDQREGQAGSAQRVHAADLNIVRGPHLAWSSQVAYNQNRTTPAGGVHRWLARSAFEYESNEWEFTANYKYVGRGVDLGALGFEPQTDRHSGVANAEWKPFLDRHGVRQMFLEVNYDFNMDTAGLLHDAGSDVDLSARFQNFWFARLRLSYNQTRFFDFTPEFGRTERTRIYQEPRLIFFLESNQNRPVYFNYQLTVRRVAQFRDNFYGREQRHDLNASLRLLGTTTIEFRGSLVREFLLDRTPFQVRRLFITRVNHHFTRRLRMRTLGQVTGDRLGRNFNLNSIIAYDFTARSAAIVGYNHQRRSPGRPDDLGHEFFFKFSYLFHF